MQHVELGLALSKLAPSGEEAKLPSGQQQQQVTQDDTCWQSPQLKEILEAVAAGCDNCISTIQGVRDTIYARNRTIAGRENDLDVDQGAAEREQQFNRVQVMAEHLSAAKGQDSGDRRSDQTEVLVCNQTGNQQDAIKKAGE